MKIYDTFSFFNELELLKLRCEELKPLNPIHVLVESTYTHTGESKELIYENNKHLFSEYNIRHVIVDDMPNNGDAWANEKYQRDCANRQMHDIEGEDLVIISDLDEIPRWQAIQFYEPRMGIAGLQMDKYSCYANLLEGVQNWGVGKVTQIKHIPEMYSLSMIRNSGADFQIYFGGWHMSFLGGIEKMKDKLFAYAHTETLTPDLLNSLEYKYENGQSLWGKDYWKFVKIDESFPTYLRENQDEFKHLIKKV